MKHTLSLESATAITIYTCYTLSFTLITLWRWDKLPVMIVVFSVLVSACACGEDKKPMCVRGAACDWYKGVRSRCKWVECSSVKPNQRKRKRNELERKWERGCGSVWSSQPGLLSHLQPLSLFYTQIHTHTDTVHILSLTHTHTCPRTGW